MPRKLTVQRGDGQAEAFDESRIADSILQAISAVDEGDADVARELAGVVALFLQKREPHAPLHPADIEDMVERVLLETGHLEAARAYIRQRQARSAPPAGSADAPGDLFPGHALSVLSADGGGLSMWDPGRITAALAREAGLDPGEARAIAAAVEETILRSGLDVLSSSVVRSLVDAELFRRGHHQPLARQAALGMPAYDLGRLLGPGPEAARSPEEAVQRLARAAFRQFAFREVFSASTARAHARGDIHVEGAHAPTHLEEAFVSLETVKRFGAFPFRPDGRAEPPATAAETADELGRLASAGRGFFRNGIDAGYLNLCLAPLLEHASDADLDRTARHVWNALAAPPGPPASANITLGVPDLLRFTEALGPGGRRTGRGLGEFWTAAEKFTRALVRQAAASPAPAPAAPAVSVHVDANTFQNPSALSLLRFLCRNLGPSFSPTFVFEREPNRMQVHGRHLVKVRDAELFRHPSRMRLALVQTVAVNLVRPALAAGPGDIEAFCSRLEETLRKALDALEEKRAFVRRLAKGDLYAALTRPAPDRRPFLDLEAGVYALSLVGLAEAMAALRGPGRDGEGLTPGLSALSFLLLQTREEARQRGMHLAFGSPCSDEARRRFALADARRHPSASEPFGGEPYACGLSVRSRQPHDLLDVLKRLGARYSLVESRLGVSGLLDLSDGPPETFFDLVCETFESTDVVFLRFD